MYPVLPQNRPRPVEKKKERGGKEKREKREKKRKKKQKSRKVPKV